MKVKLRIVNIKQELLDMLPVGSKTVYDSLSHYNRKHIQRAIREMVEDGYIVKGGNLWDGRSYILKGNGKTILNNNI